MLNSKPWYTSIRFKLIIPMAVVFMSLIGTYSIFMTGESIATTEQILSQLRNEIVLRVASTLDSKLEQAIKLNEMHAQSIKNGILNVNDIGNRERYFSAILQPYEDIAMTYIGQPDGSFYGARRLQNGTLQIVRNNATTSGHSEYYDIDSTGKGTTLSQVFENFDARKRPWYQNALDKKDLTFSGLYSHFVFKEPTITASIPYYEDGQLIGIFGVDFLMTWLAETLSSLSVGNNGIVFIVDSENQLIATSTGESVFKTVDKKAVNVLATDSSSPVIREAIQADFSNQLSARVPLNGRTYLIGKDRLNVEGVNWTVYTVIDKGDFTASLDSAIIRMNVVGITATILFLIFIAYSNHKFAAPILALNKHAQMLSEGSFESVKSFKHSPEMDDLIGSFNEMGTKIQSFVGDLQREVEKQTKMYETAAIEANSANVAKSRFLATMSHELRTPLTGILGMVELLKTTELSQEQLEYVILSENTAQTLTQLINSVLDYSKIEAQQVEIEQLPFELKDFQQDIENLANLYVRSKGLAFEFIIDQNIPHQLIGDRFRLRQIVTNLIGNAVKFTKVGQIKATVELEALHPEDNQLSLKFSISDTGLGMTPDQQKILFKPFSQADVSTTRQYGGTGLGLAICKNLVELMGGTIAVQSVYGEGSTFTFTCNVGFVSAADHIGHNDASLISDAEIASDWIKEILSQRLTILLVEDSAVIYEYIKKLALKSNWTLYHGSNGEEGLSLYHQHKEKLDLVIMDIEMPILDGYEVTKLIRQHENETQTPPVRVIAISANVLAGEPEKCLECGMNGYVSKPFRIEQLLAHF